jgi:hypothetical protein
MAETMLFIEALEMETAAPMQPVQQSAPIPALWHQWGSTHLGWSMRR